MNFVKLGFQKDGREKRIVDSFLFFFLLLLIVVFVLAPDGCIEHPVDVSL